MNIITGYTGEQHITSDQDRDGNQGSYGTGSYILDVGEKLAATIVSANEVRIADGALSHQGCLGNIDKGSYESLEISNGTQGMKRSDLIVCRYEKNSETNVESLSLVVIEGTPAVSNPADPEYSSGDIQTGDSPVDMPLFRVNINGISISSITRIASYVRTQAEMDTAISTINSNYWSFPRRGNLTSSDNMADLKTQGLYATQGSSNQPQGLPEVVSYGFVYVVVNGTIVHQYVVRPRSSILVREWSGSPGSWGAWQKITMTNA